MSWIIKDGFITNVDGDGIRIEDPSSGGTISGMHISNVGGSGIVIGGGDKPKEPDKFDLSQLLDILESRIHELPDNQQELAHKTIEKIRENPNTFNTRRGLKIIYDIAIGVTGSSIGGILASLVS